MHERTQMRMTYPDSQQHTALTCYFVASKSGCDIEHAVKYFGVPKEGCCESASV